MEIRKKLEKYKAVSHVISILAILSLGVLFIFSGSVVADNWDHMDGEGMMGWGFLGSSSMWFWMIGYWIVFLIVGALVYSDANGRRMNGLLWFALVILPWIGILFLIIYLIVREEKTIKGVPQKSANAILDERYVRGEITQEEYKRMKRDISE